MADKKEIKLKKTITGAQQFGSAKAGRNLKNKIEKDIKLYINKKMTAAEFKKKYGFSVLKVQNIVYAANNEATRTDYKSAGAAKRADKAALRLAKNKIEIDKMAKRDAELNKLINAINNRMANKKTTPKKKPAKNGMAIVISVGARPVKKKTMPKRKTKK